MLVCLLAAVPACGRKPSPSNPAAGQPAGQADTNRASQPSPTPTPAETPFRRTGRGPVTPTATIEFHNRPPTPTPIPIKPELASTPLPQGLEAISPENAGRLIELARWGKGKVQQMLWSPDGRWLAAAFTSGIFFYDSATLSQAGWIDISTDAYTSLVFAPDGSALVAGLMAGGTRAWSVPGGDLLQAYPELSWQPGNNLSFTSDGAWLVSSTFLDVSVWRTRDASLAFKSLISSQGFTLSPDGSLLATPEQDKLTVYAIGDGSIRFSVQLQGQVNALAYAPDGKIMAVAVEDIPSGSQVVQVINAIDGSRLQSLAFEGKRLAQVAFAPGGATLAAWTKGNEDAQLWRTGGWKPLLKLQDRQFAFSPDGSLVAAWTFSEPEARVYRTSDGVQAYTLPGHQPGVIDVIFSPLGDAPEENGLATISGSGNLRLWNAKNGSLIRPLGEVASQPVRSAIAPGKATAAKIPVFAAQMQDGSLHLWQASDGSLIKTLEDAPRSIADLAFDPGGKLILYRFNDKGGCRLSAADGSPQNCFTVSQAKTVSALSADGSAAFLTPRGDGEKTGSPFWIKDTTAYSLEIKLTLPFSLTLAAFPDDGKGLLLASPYGGVTRFSVKDGRQISKLKLALDKLGTQPLGQKPLEILKLFASPDGQTLVSATSDGSLVVWKASDGSLRYRLEYPGGAASPGALDGLSIAFSDDGSLLAAGTPDHPVGLFRLEDGSLVRTIDVDAGYARRLAFVPGGQVLVSGAGGHIKLRKTADGSELSRFDALGWITGLAISPEGRRIATVTEDGVIQVWGVRPKK